MIGCVKSALSIATLFEEHMTIFTLTVILSAVLDGRGVVFARLTSCKLALKTMKRWHVRFSRLSYKRVSIFNAEMSRHLPV